mmetsp:Transcript_75960/g.246522  ORF Transcript_75960/g.246522 Transcript_75960/m.246522 type:complete len:326 (-) Transcript_75960:935-1912(-)
MIDQMLPNRSKTSRTTGRYQLPTRGWMIGGVSSHVGVMPDEGPRRWPVAERSFEGLGRCLVATRVLQRGELVLAEAEGLRRVALDLCGEGGPSASHAGAGMRWDAARVGSLLALLEAFWDLPAERRGHVRQHFDGLPAEASPIRDLVLATAAALHDAGAFCGAELSELEDLCAVKVVNCHEGVRGGAALYEVLSRLAHSCSPNCIYTPSESSAADKNALGQGRVVAARPIAPGEVLSISYLPQARLVGDRAARRSAVFAARGFRCACAALTFGDPCCALSAVPVRGRVPPTGLLRARLCIKQTEIGAALHAAARLTMVRSALRSL